MVYKRVIKVSDKVYGELRKIMSEYGFPSPNQAIIFLLNEFKSTEELFDIKVGGKTPYYTICSECGRLAHFLRTVGGKTWYYCPNCNRVFEGK